MADISLPGDTGAFMDYDTEDPREEREGGNLNLRKLRTQQSKARRKSRELAKSSKKQVAILSVCIDGPDEIVTSKSPEEAGTACRHFIDLDRICAVRIGRRTRGLCDDPVLCKIGLP